MERLKGKVAVVTGASRGIGRGIALCLAEEGADVALFDLPVDRELPIPVVDVRETAQAVEALGRRALVVYGDVTDRAQVAGLFAQTVATLGRIDLVVANAAMSIREPVLKADWDAARRTLEVTQFGVFHTCQFGAQALVQQSGGGRIVIIGSVLAEMPSLHSAAYNMAKAGVVHFGRTLAAELAPHHITVNMVNPGYTDTPGERSFASEATIQAAGPKVPLGRLGTPRDIGRAVVYLASEDGEYITGSVLTVDGGYRLLPPK
jgi:glucose 1-dehydrogenase